MNNATAHIETVKRSAERSRSKLIPALRFKEFEGEWNEVRLIEIVKIMTDYVSSGSFESLRNNVIVYDDLNYAVYVRLTDLRHSLKHKSLKYVDKASYEFLSKSNLHGGELLIANIGAKVGDVFMMPFDFGKATIAPNMVVIRENKSKFVSSFLFFVFNSFGGRKAINTAISGSGQPKLSKTDFKKIKLSITTLPEQQKIASFLSVVDEKIQQLTKTKQLLEQYKKGVMQQLFSSQLRFKDENGNAYPEWEWVGGNELFDNISDKKHNSDLPILAITQDQGAIPRELINYQMTVTEKSVASYKVVQIGDFVISLRTFQGGIEFSDYHGICSPAYIILRPSSDDVDRTFYKFYLKTSNYIKQLQKNLEGIRDGKMISYKYFSEIKIPFPSHPEQQKIATYLSSIDNKIEAVKNQITQTQTFKKGLLQQMFV